MEIKKIFKILKDEKGTTTPFLLAIILAIILISTVAYEYMRLLITATAIRDNVQSAVIESVTDNWDNSYQGLREGYSGAYTYSDNWNELYSKGNVYLRLQRNLGVVNESGTYVKYIDDFVEYKISNLNVNVTNTEFAPNSSNIEQLNISGTVDITVPMSYSFVSRDMEITMRLNAKFTPKF